MTTDPSLNAYGITAARLVEVPGIRHQVASVFWSFMNSSGTIWDGSTYTNDTLFEDPFYATGYPIAEPYWATVQLAGTPRDVLIQCFERRCLTYTPGNPAGWDVEAGNVGQHYFIWRYGRMAKTIRAVPLRAALPHSPRCRSSSSSWRSSHGGTGRRSRITAGMRG